MILLKLVAFAAVAVALIIGFELLVDVIRFGGVQLANGNAAGLGASLGALFLALGLLVSGLNGLLG